MATAGDEREGPHAPELIEHGLGGAVVAVVMTIEEPGDTGLPQVPSRHRVHP
jgi:hypothetical protein